MGVAIGYEIYVLKFVASIASGGSHLQVPDGCRVSFDRRPVHPETSQVFFAEFESYFAQWLPDTYEFDVQPAYPDSDDLDVFNTDPDTELVQTLAHASGGDVRTSEAATQASYFADDIPSVVFEPDVLADEEGPVAHADREYVTRQKFRPLQKRSCVW
jgi:acetylornithine deacetylase/succinyl-diaminopimelate desuccinylase-like protein